MSERWNVVIVGGEFGGLSAAQHLNSKSGGRDAYRSA
jgi:NADH dehydrogenase FAD-containing subunit